MANDDRRRVLAVPVREAMERTGIGAVACDGEGRLTMISPSLRRLFELNSKTYSERELAGRFGLVRPDGTPMPAAETPLTRAAGGEFVKDVVIGLRNAEGQQLWLTCNGGPIGDGEGGWVLTQDITAQHRAAALGDELRGRLEHTFSHEFREPLADLLGGLSTLRDLEDATSDLNRSLAAIERAAWRLDELVHTVAELIEKQEALHRAGRTPDGAPRRTG